LTKHPTIRVLLLEDEPLVRTALQKLLESWPGFEVIAEAATTGASGQLTVNVDPDVVLLSLQNDDDVDLPAIRELARTFSRARVLVLLGECTPELRIRIVQTGARGVVLRNKAAEELRKAIEIVSYTDEVWLDRKSLVQAIRKLGITEPIINPAEESRLALLTGREREVVILVAEGFKNKDIGQRLSISETTVRHHLTTIFSKLNVTSRFELIAFLHRHHFPIPTGSHRSPSTR
jgi:DNA-binding NarL/FixJ family response regulator